MKDGSRSPSDWLQPMKLTNIPERVLQPAVRQTTAMAAGLEMLSSPTTQWSLGFGDCGRCYRTRELFRNPYGAIARCGACRRLDDHDLKQKLRDLIAAHEQRILDYVVLNNGLGEDHVQVMCESLLVFHDAIAVLLKARDQPAKNQVGDPK